MDIKNLFKRGINKLPYISQLIKENKKLNNYAQFPAGHFYSPIVHPDEIKKKRDLIWQEKEASAIKGIQFNEVSQLSLLKNLSTYYSEIPFLDHKSDTLRYFYKNKFYSYTDAIVLHTLIRHQKPKQIIEIGSGFSSAIMLDTNELFFNNEIQLSFIEPYPERLRSLMKNEDKNSCTIYETFIQDFDTTIFTKLEAGDMVFVDSSHIVKTGSDVNFILFEILPMLQKGVLVHFHDIFYPFEYPEKWVMNGFNWNENYFIRAFLMYNNNFEIELFSHFIHQKYPQAFTKMPLTYNNTGGNLWLRKK